MREDRKIPKMLCILRMTVVGAMHFENEVIEEVNRFSYRVVLVF